MARLQALWNRLAGHDVFISYSSQDVAWAVAVEKLLRLGRYSVFRDDTGLTTGDHLERLLREVRRSTMLLVLVSDASAQSEWVHREVQAHLERPRPRWRIAPVFLDHRYPAALPERLRELGQFHGVKLPMALTPAVLEGDRAFLEEATSHFDATRRVALRRWLALATVVAVAAVVSSLIWLNRRNTARDAWLTRAERLTAAARFADAEVALAEAWRLDPSASTLAAYRHARSRRALERPIWLGVADDESVLAIDAADGAPYVLVRSSDDRGGLFLRRHGERVPLADPCTASPLVATRKELVVWSCGRQLGAMLAGQPGARTVVLPAEPVALRLRDGGVDLLFREGTVAQIGRFTAPALEPTGLVAVADVPEAGEMGLCAAGSAAAWSIAADRGGLVFRSWNRNGAALARMSFRVPEASGTGAVTVGWVARVIDASACDRFFVDYAPFTLSARSSFEMVRLRPDAARPVDRFDGDVDALEPTPETAGVEAIYLTGSKELRAFLLTSPVVLTSRVRTLAPDVERFVRWPRGEREAWTIAATRQWVSVFRNQELWSVHPLGVGDPLRIITSPDGGWVALQGEQRSVAWRRAAPFAAEAPPDPDTITIETAVPR